MKEDRFKKILITVALFILTGLFCVGRNDCSISYSSEHKELTLNEVKNATYHISFRGFPDKIKLVDGTYESTGENGITRSVVIYGGDKVAFGRLDGDENKDAAVVLCLNTGGSGSFRVLAAMVNQNGAPFHKASALLGDRVLINSIIIKDRGIFLDMVTHGPKDPPVNPTVKKKAEFRLRGVELNEIVEGN